MRSETLHVTSKTTFSELQQFADKLDDRMRLRARKVEGGYELYAKDSKPSLWSRITGRSAQTRANARDAVFSVIDRAARAHGYKNIGQTYDALYSGISSKDVKGQALKALLDTVAGGETLENRGPGLHKLPDTLRKNLINHAAQHIADGLRSGNGTLDEIADKIASDWRADIDEAQSLPDKTALTRLGLSEGTAFIYDMRDALADMGAAKNDEACRRILERAFTKVIPNLLPGQQNATGEIALNGLSYRPVKTLGKGGYGKVDLYECTTDPSKKIALKSAIVPQDATQEQIAQVNEGLKREANMHIAILGPRGHDNVVGFAGAVRMLDGNVAVALEYAPNGSAEEAKDAINSALRRGMIDAGEAKAIRLTLLKDMAAGISHLQRANKDFVHYDFKAANVLVGENGTAKITDFGLSAKSRKLDKVLTIIPENSHGQVSPELENLRDAVVRAKKVDVEPRREADRAAFEERFKKLTEHDRDDLIRRAQDGAVRNTRRAAVSEYDISGADTWAFGHTAFRMFYDRELVNFRFNAACAKRIQEFGRGSGPAIDTRRSDADGPVAGNPNELWGTQTQGPFAGSSGHADVDDLLNGLLYPDAARRMTIAQALSHPALSAPEVGSDDTRKKLVAVLQAYRNPPQQAQGQLAN